MSASSENFQRRALRRNRRIATALLGSMVVLFILPKSKDRIGEGLAIFIERNFLTSDLIRAKLRSIGYYYCAM